MIIINRIRRLAALAGLSLLMASTGHAQAVFKIGQPAPAFKAGRWVKGAPVTELRPGQIYVMEFWATWCGPCRAAMPHLTELAHKHAGKVTMIGVNFMEHATGEKADRMVDKFVEQMGKDLDYPNCRDTADDYLLKNWFKPTKSPGIPTTIVVDGQGKIAWIGHPKDLDKVLDELLAGTFDYVKSAAAHSNSAGRNEAMMAVFTEYGEAMKAKEWAKAVAVVDNNPQYANSMWLMRFMALMHADSAQALEQLKDVVAKKERTAGSFLTAVSMTDDLPMELYQYAAEHLAESEEPFNLGSRASLAFRLGDFAKAVEYQQKFKDAVLKMERKPTPEMIDKIEDDLKMYQGKQ